MEDLGNGCCVGGEVALGPLGDTASTPSNQGILGKPRIRVLDLYESELDATLVEVFDEFRELAICRGGERRVSVCPAM